jgi:hypothetical protein
VNTFCKGKPKTVKNFSDIYVCEFKVDKRARTFSKYKHEYVLNTKQYCFDLYDQKLKVKRDFQPHLIEINKALTKTVKTNKNKKGLSKLNKNKSKQKKLVRLFYKKL